MNTTDHYWSSQNSQDLALGNLAVLPSVCMASLSGSIEITERVAAGLRPGFQHGEQRVLWPIWHSLAAGGPMHVVHVSGLLYGF